MRYVRLSAWGLAGAVAAIAATSPVAAQVAYTGANNGTWITGSNWAGGASPGVGGLVGTDVLLQNANTVLLSSGDFTVGDVLGTGNLTVSGGGTLRASAPGKRLGFAGTLTMSGGTLDGFTIETTNDVSALSGIFRAITLLANLNMADTNDRLDQRRRLRSRRFGQHHHDCYRLDVHAGRRHHRY